MPDFADFIAQLSRGGTSGTTVNDILRSRGSNNESDRKLQDIAEMFLSAERQVDSDLETFGNKEIVGELTKLNRGFEAYADNLSMMKFYLSKFSDENAEVGREDVDKLRELVAQNASLVRSIDSMRNDDREFNQKLQEVERRNEFHFRSQGVMDQEQQRVQDRYNIDSSQLWEGIGNDIEQFRQQVETDFKTGLIEGIGGPIGVMTRQVLLPGFKAIKESAIGQKLGPKFEKLGDRIKNMFSRDASELQTIEDTLNEQSELEQSAQQEQDKLADILSDNSAQYNDGNNNVIDSVNNAVRDIVLPSPSDVKRKMIYEDRARRTIGSQKEPGIFSKVLNAIEQSNAYLYHISDTIKDQKNRIDDGYESLAELVVISTNAIDMDREDSVALLGSLDLQEKLLREVNQNGEIQNVKTELINRFNEDVFAYNKEAIIESDDDRDEDIMLQNEILDELDDLNKKDFSGGSGGLLQGLLGKGGKGLLSALPTLLKLGGRVLGPVGIGIGAAVGYDKMVDPWRKGGGGIDFSSMFQHYKTKWFGKSEQEMEMERALSYPEESQEYMKQMQELVTEQERVSHLSPQEKAAYYNKAYKDLEKSVPKQDYTGKVRGILEVSEADKKYITDYTEILKSGITKEDLVSRLSMEGDKDIQVGSQVIGWGVSDVEKAEIAKDLFSRQFGGSENLEITGTLNNNDIDVRELNTSAVESPTELDKAVVRVEKEMYNQRKENGTKVMNTPVKNNNVVVSTGENKKQRLDDISLLPEDSFGLVLVNSGVNF